MIKKMQIVQSGRLGRKPLLSAEHSTVLHAITQEMTRSSLDLVGCIAQPAGAGIAAIIKGRPLECIIRIGVLQVRCSSVCRSDPQPRQCAFRRAQ